MIFEVLNEQGLQPVAEYVSTQNRPIVTLNGTLGAGKTTFIKTLCAHLRVQQTVSSPTFGLVNEYTTATGEIIYHFDLYRINNIEETYDIGFDEYLHSGHRCLIEWPDVALPLLKEVEGRLLSITIHIKENGVRIFEIT